MIVGALADAPPPDDADRVRPDGACAYLFSLWWVTAGGDCCFRPRGGGRSVCVAPGGGPPGYAARMRSVAAVVGGIEDRTQAEVLAGMAAMSERQGEPWRRGVAELSLRFARAADRVAALPAEARFGDKAIVGLAMRHRRMPGYDKGHEEIACAFAHRLGFPVVGGNWYPEARVLYVAATIAMLRQAAERIPKIAPGGPGSRGIEEMADVVAGGHFRGAPADDHATGYGVAFWDPDAETDSGRLAGWEGAADSVITWVQHLGGVARTFPSIPGHLHAEIAPSLAPRIAEHSMVRQVTPAPRITLR